MESYTTVQKEGRFEYEDRKSVFIGTAVPVTTEQQALDFLTYIKRKYPDAKHHVYAYVLKENSIMRFSDDKEPQGTAGMPVLDAIRKKGCTDVAIAVIRYFGGTLLGTGGLVRAYSQAAVGAIENANIITYELYERAKIEASYSDYQRITPLLETLGFRTENIEYSDNVTIYGKIKSAAYEDLTSKIIEMSSARVKCIFLEEIFDF